MKYLILISIFLITSSCAPFMESPFSDQLMRPDRNLNESSINSLGDPNADGKIRIAVFADPHQNYKDLDQIFYNINQTTDVDFIVGLGDFTNSGYNLEYDQFLTAYSFLNRAKFMVLGNHDAIGAGVDLFRKAFGYENYAFDTATHRFIFFSGNNWESPHDFKPAWLKETVTSSTKPVIIFSHEQLLDTERYKDDVIQVFSSIVADPKVQLALNGHNHVYKMVMEGTTPLLQVGRTQGSHWVLLEIQGSNLCINRMDTQEQDCRSLKSYP